MTCVPILYLRGRPIGVRNENIGQKWPNIYPLLFTVLMLQTVSKIQTSWSGKISEINYLHAITVHSAWKVSIFGVILACIFPHLDWMRRDTDKNELQKLWIRTLFKQYKRTHKLGILVHLLNWCWNLFKTFCSGRAITKLS